MESLTRHGRHLLGLTAALGMLITGCAHQPTAPTPFGEVYERAPDQGAAIEKSRVLLLEFTNFQCPFCRRSQDTMDELVDRYGDQLTVVTLHNPLLFHEYAGTLAKLAVVAQQEGKLQTIKRLLFEPYEAGATEAKVQASLRMNDAEFKEVLSSPATAQRVEHHRRIANAVGLAGTPNFSINGHVVKGAQPLEEFTKIIDSELEAARDKGAIGGPWIKGRIKENAPDLHAYLFEGKPPPEVAGEKRFEGKPPPEVAGKSRHKKDDRVYYVPVDHEKDIVFGPRDARVTVVTFIGFECPFSKRFYPSLMRLLKEYPDDVRLHIKQAALPNHRWGVASAQAALCARDQGKYEQMAELLFERQGEQMWPSSYVLARQVGLDETQLSTCQSTEQALTQSDHDHFIMQEANGRGTPHTYVNGKKLRGALPWEVLRDLVDQELKGAHSTLVNSGLRGDALKRRVAGLYEEIISTGVRMPIVGKELHALRRPDKSEPIRYGSATAKLKLTVFTDYLCPLCARIEPMLEEVRAHYGEDLAVEIRHFPISRHAARAAQCAHEAGRGLEMHRLLMSRQTELKDGKWAEYAAELGISASAFSSCMDSERATELVAQDQAIGTKAGVRGTPSLYLHADGINEGARAFSPLNSVRAFVLSIDRHVAQSSEAAKE